MNTPIFSASSVPRHVWCLVLLMFLLMGCQADQLPRRPIPVPESPAALQRGDQPTPSANPVPSRTITANSPTQANQAAQAAHGGRVAGLRWSVPVRWKLGLAGSMRVATYWIPGTDANSTGECSVFYFGSDQGGSITANFDRWKQQFQPDPGKIQLTQSDIKQFQVRNMKVATLELQGTYLSSMRPMDSQKIPKTNHDMFGVIVNAPQGMVFFKCVGPHTTMQAAKSEFQMLVQSFQPSNIP